LLRLRPRNFEKIGNVSFRTRFRGLKERRKVRARADEPHGFFRIGPRAYDPAGTSAQSGRKAQTTHLVGECLSGSFLSRGSREGCIDLPAAFVVLGADRSVEVGPRLVYTSGTSRAVDRSGTRTRPIGPVGCLRSGDRHE